MLTQVLTIARNTFTESIRQPIYVVLLLLAGLLLLLTPSLSAYTLETGRGDNKMLIDLGLGTIFLAGLLLASFTATGVLSKEIENKTVLTVVSKPVARPMFVLGKFLGVLTAIGMAHVILSIVFILTLRHGVMQTARDQFDMPVIVFGSVAAFGSLALASWGNYYLGWPFNSTLVRSLLASGTAALALVLVISPQWAIQSPLVGFTAHDGELIQICLGLVMLLEAVMILTAVAIACSTRLGQVMTLLICFGVQILGLAMTAASRHADARAGLTVQASYFESFGRILAAESEAHLKVVALFVKLLAALMPNMHFLWPADAITQGHPFDLTYLGVVSAYAVLYSLAVLCLGVALFQTREVS